VARQAGDLRVYNEMSFNLPSVSALDDRARKPQLLNIKHQTPAREQELLLDEGPSSGSSWIVPRVHPKQLIPEAPFGYVDLELKAYFRTVDDR
jgi:hypothetical protein